MSVANVYDINLESENLQGGAIYLLPPLDPPLSLGLQFPRFPVSLAMASEYLKHLRVYILEAKVVKSSLQNNAKAVGLMIIIKVGSRNLKARSTL